MLKYYNFVTSEKMPTLSAKISWSHYDEVLKYDDINKNNYYLSIVEDQNLSVRKLRTIIKSNEYVIKYCSDDRIITREYEIV